MEGELLQKHSLKFNLKCLQSSIFYDYSNDYYQEKVDQDKLLKNLVSACTLTGRSQINKIMVLGQSKEHLKISHMLSDEKDIFAPIVSLRPKELIEEIAQTKGAFSALFCGDEEAPEVPPPVAAASCCC